MTRPTGITILSILNIIGGILLIVVGVYILMLGPFIILKMVSKEEIPALLSLWALKILNILAIGFVIFGIIALVVSYGLLKGYSWAWWFEIILCAIGIVYGIFILPKSLIGIIVNGIIILYLTRPHVREFFEI